MKLKPKDLKLAERCVSAWNDRREILEAALERPNTGIRETIMAEVLGTGRLLHPVDFEGQRIGYAVSREHAREMLIEAERLERELSFQLIDLQHRGRA